MHKDKTPKICCWIWNGRYLLTYSLFMIIVDFQISWLHDEIIIPMWVFRWVMFGALDSNGFPLLKLLLQTFLRVISEFISSRANALRANDCKQKNFQRLPFNLLTLDRSTSSTVQKEASAFLYICQISWYWMGNITNLRGFSRSRGSSWGSNAGEGSCFTTSIFSSSEFAFLVTSTLFLTGDYREKDVVSDYTHTKWQINFIWSYNRKCK